MRSREAPGGKASREGSDGIAVRKDLHDGRSLWYDSPRRTVRCSRLTQDCAFEIVIIGGGISGAISALTLSAAGHEVAVIDRREPGLGSTLASTALIQFEIDTPLTALSGQIGARKAERAYRRSFQAVRDLGALIAAHKLPASWREREALYLAGNRMGFRGLKSEVTARRQIGLPSTYLAAREVRDIYGIEATGAVLSGGAAELNPAQTSAACLRTAQKCGARIYAPCDVVAIERDGRRISLATRDGPTLSCRKVIFATGYEVVEGVPRDAFEIVSSWAIATQPLPPDTLWPGRCLIWEASDPYLYLRTTHDSRIVAGGEDSGLTDPTRRAAAIPSKSATILRKLRRLLGKHELEIAYAWAGAFAESPTGLPVIQQLAIPGAFAILGCGGNGITFSMIAAQLAKAWVEGRKDPDADLFVGL